MNGKNLSHWEVKEMGAETKTLKGGDKNGKRK